MKRQTFMLVCMMLLCASVATAQVSHPKVHHHSTYDHSGAIISDQDIKTIYSHATPTVTCEIDNLTGDINCDGTATFGSVIGATGTYTNLFATDVFVLGTMETATATTGGGFGSTGCTLTGIGDIICDGYASATIYYGDGSALTGISYSTPTLQSVLETGNTGARTDDNTMVISATSTWDGIQVDHSSMPSMAGDGIQITMPNTTGTGNALKISSTNTGDAVDITKATRAGWGIDIADTGTTGGVHVVSSGGGRAMQLHQNSVSGSNALYAVSTSTGNPTAYIQQSSTTGTQPTLQLYNSYNTALGMIGTNPPVLSMSSTVASQNKTSFVFGTDGFLSIGHGVVFDKYNMFYASGTVDAAGIKLTNNNNSANGINLIFDRVPVDGGGASDVLSNVASYGLNASGTSVQYGAIQTQILDNATATFSGSMYFRVSSNGGITESPIVMSGGATETVQFGWSPQIIADVDPAVLTCDSSTRGYFAYNHHATDDTLSVCMKAASNYAWVQIKP